MSDDTTREVAEQLSDTELFEQNKRLFMRMMNHNLRSPLASMLSCLRVLESGAVTDPKDAANLVKNAAGRGEDMMRLLDDMMMMFQVGEPDDAPPDTFDPATAARDAAAHFAQAAGEKNISIIVVAPEQPLSVTIGRKRLYIALRHIAENALRYSHPGTKITIELSCTGGTVDITIRNRGIIIEPEDIAENIYVAYWRAGAAKQFADAGTGLGLAIVRTIVSQCGGTISAQSSEANGTAFTVSIPNN